MGTYLTVHFAQLLPFAAEIWSEAGTLGTASLNFTHGAFPNLLNLMDSPLGVQGFIGGLLVLSVALTTGWQRPVICVLLWYGWACLFHRNNLTANPGLPMVGWLLLAMALIPRGEPWCLGKKPSQEWRLPPILWWGAWAISALAYTLSGLDKLEAPSWRDGTAMVHLLNNPLARDTFLRDTLLYLPSQAHVWMTWSALAVEVLFAPLCLFRITRPWAWLSILGLHLGILSTVQFADLTLGVLMLHLFIFDPRWFSPRIGPLVVYYDGVCGFCQLSVQTLLDLDPDRRFVFSPLQGKHAEEHLEEKLRRDLESIVVFDGRRVYSHSRAILVIARHLGGWGLLVQPLRCLPSFLLDPLYRFVAQRRYRIFGKVEACRFLTPDERERFLD